MNLTEAIKHSEEKAKELCGKCADEHKQLAKWLKDLEYFYKKYKYTDD